MKDNTLKVLSAFMQIAQNSTYGFPTAEPVDPYPYERLGNGYELRPIQILAEGGQVVLENRSKYSHLYRNGEQVSDQVFRKGGMGGDFRDGYCSLIHYTRDSKRDDGFSFGTHVIINGLGEIVLSGTGISDYPSLCGGHLGKLKDTYYDLRTGEPVLTASSSGAISSKNLIILEHRYDWYKKSLPLGVYTINKATCEVTKIDDIK